MKQVNLLTLALLLLSGLGASLWGQETFPYNGVYDQREGYYALTNATIIPRAGERLDNAALIVRNGRIEAMGRNLTVPKGAVVIDLKGKYIYPSFVDIYSQYGLPKPEGDGSARGGGRRAGVYVTTKQGAYAWNEALHPEFEAYTVFTADPKTAKTLREQGFGAVASHAMDGISRGSSTVVSLAEDRPHETILKERGAHHLSFRKGSSKQDYPSSLMGSVALLRQTYLDGQWYAGQNEEVNVSLDAWNRMQELPQIFEVDSWQDALRAGKIAREFGKQYIIKGGGDEYRQLSELKTTSASFILPLNFPEPYDVADPYDARQVSLEQLRHWELAPANPARVAQAGIPFALTANGLKKPEDFRAAVQKAIEHGLTEEQALRALTETPAQLLGVTEQVGTLAKGKVANFLITSGPVFGKETTVFHNWVQGRPFVLQELDAADLTGRYRLTVGGQSYDLVVSGKPGKPEMQLERDTQKVKVTHSFNDGLITLSFSPEKGGKLYRLSGTVGDKQWTGRGQDQNGQWVNWRAEHTGAATANAEDKKDEKPAQKPEYASQITHPFTAFGWTERPKSGTYLIRNATVWTNEAQGRLENADVLIRDGKIAGVGQNLNAAGATVIEGTGKHVTPGIIDEHTHIGVQGGVNEGTQASSAEVRIGDVVDATDIDIYRQLAGGVTAAQILHGSANPIGGQSEVIKFRWGFTPDELRFDAAPEFIKFALGENVKQSNWNLNVPDPRFPQTRMGVEQVYESYFTRAREYEELKKSGKPYRKDLELEALLEILNDQRFITCHSYQQGEINMMMKVAERHGFNVNTFTHILEGYKVADKMAQHGAGGSTFSDWWAYKFEVVEAIPHNGAIMHEQGVTVAFNSDDAEMARRLNQEAAKAVLFGGVSEEEALKFVTLNPAKLLHVDDRTGSLKVDKDADVVVWSDNPLSVYAKAEKTFVDGIKFFDLEEDQQRREAVARERNALIQKMLQEKEKGANTQRPTGRARIHYHCDTLTEYR